MKKMLAVCVSFLIVLSLFAGCGVGETPVETTEAPEQFVTTTFVSNGTSECVIVHDGTSSASALANDVRNMIAKEFGVVLNALHGAAGEHPMEIVIGNCRPIAEKTAKKLKTPFDFALKVEENALVLSAVNEISYRYLSEYLSREVFVKTADGTLQLDSDDNILYTESALADTHYIDYLAQGGKNFDLEQVFDWAIYENEDTKLPYRIYVPFNYSPDKEYPLLVNLHGAGLRGDDNERHLAFIDQTMRLPDRTLDEAIIIFPQCPQSDRWVDSDWAMGSYNLDKVPESNELKAVVELVGQLQEAYNVDENRIYACGFSMGGYATWNLLMNHPDLFCAGIAMCGAGDPNKADILKDIPIWAIHGAKDPTVPVAGSRDMVTAIENAGGELIHYTELPDNEHDVWTYTYNSFEMFDWLLSQSKA